MKWPHVTIYCLFIFLFYYSQIVCRENITGHNSAPQMIKKCSKFSQLTFEFSKIVCVLYCIVHTIRKKNLHLLLFLVDANLKWLL